jgi:hypothetical protein
MAVEGNISVTCHVCGLANWVNTRNSKNLTFLSWNLDGSTSENEGLKKGCQNLKAYTVETRDGDLPFLYCRHFSSAVFRHYADTLEGK